MNIKRAAYKLHLLFPFIRTTSYRSPANHADTKQLACDIFYQAPAVHCLIKAFDIVTAQLLIQTRWLIT